MSAEYEGKMDRGSDGVPKTVKVLPRPLQRTDQVIRSLMVTGDPTGLRDASFDDGMILQGVDPFVMHFYEQLQQAIEGRFTAVDEAWYD